MLEVSVDEDCFRIISFKYSVKQTFHMTSLKLWKKEAMQVHLLLEPEMEIGYYDRIQIPQVDLGMLGELKRTA